MITAIVFILVLTVLVLIHEAGHFFVAKLFGIKVEEFGFGLPPKAFGKKFGETLYSINWLPIGGFVKLYGEDEAGAGKLKFAGEKLKGDKSRAFYARPWEQKALVVIAGVVMNFLLAVIIMSFLFAKVGIEVPGDKVSIDQVVSNSPAQQAGIKKGDIVEYINDKKITNAQEVILETKKSLGKEITIKLLSGGEEKIVKVIPRINYPKDQGPVGIAIAQNFSVKKYSWVEAPVVGFKEALNMSWLIITGIGTTISQIVTSGAVPKDVAGPVGIAQLTGQFVAIGPFAVLSFISLLSLNLAILNILPIPALDGGRLFFILIAAVTRRKINTKFESYAHVIGMALLLALIALITLHDITRLITGQPILPR